MIYKKKIIYFCAVDWFFCSHFLSRALAAKAAGYDVLVLTNVIDHEDALKQSNLRYKHINISRRSINPFRMIIELLRVAFVYWREKPDLIHQIALKPILLGVIAARMVGCRKVINAVVGGGYIFSSEQLTARILRPILKIGLKLFLNPKGSFVVFENFDDLENFADLKMVSKSSAIVIKGAGVDVEEYNDSHKIHIKNDPPIIILVARLLWDKGIAEFVQASRLIRANGISARFVIVGDRDVGNRGCIDDETLEAWLSEGVVELWGYRSDMPSVLSSATVACLPSYREGLPKVLLEAMSAGLPCITTDVPGCREVVVNNVTGLIVPPKNPIALQKAITELLEDPGKAIKFGINGRMKVEKEFSLKIINSLTINLYDNYISSN